MVSMDVVLKGLSEASDSDRKPSCLLSFCVLNEGDGRAFWLAEVQEKGK